MNIDQACRSCGGKNLSIVLRLGELPLANSLLTEAELGQPEPQFPLDVALCASCSLVQITETVPAERLFRNYLYFSSFSDTVVQNAAEIAGRLFRSRSLGPSSLVVEAASNDGYLLQHYQRDGVPVLGIEPATNIADVANGRGVPTLNVFFDERSAQQLVDERGSADVFHANNVLAHVADLNGFVSAIRHVLKDNGVAVIEVPYVKDMIDACEFDTIYHEHLCYFSLTALDRLFTRHGLIIEDVERLAIHGGSLRLFVTPNAAARPTRAVVSLLHDEQQWGVDTLDFYRDFGNRVDRLKTELRALLRGLVNEGHRIAAYGASAKGAMLLSSCGLDSELLDFVVDRSPHKQGRYMPGARLPIHAPEKLLQAMPAYVLLLVWNVADEVMKQQDEYQRRGGRFIVPIPRPQVVAG